MVLACQAVLRCGFWCVVDDDVQTSFLLFFFFIKISCYNLLNVINRLSHVGCRSSCRRTCRLGVIVYLGMVTRGVGGEC